MRVKIKYLFSAVLLIASMCVKAQTVERPLYAVLQGVSNMSANSSVYVEDDKWWVPTEKAKLNLSGYYRIKNAVTFSLREDSSVLIKTNFTASASVIIYDTTSTGASDSTVQTFTINYDTSKGATYDLRRVFTFYDGFKVRAKFKTNITFTPSLSPADTLLIKSLLRLENEMQIVREYIFACNPSISLSLNDSVLNTTGEMVAGWSPIDGATEYDLEWTYIDQESLSDPDLYKTSGSLDAKKIFTDNATRVTINSSDPLVYHIPMLYDTAGVLYVRLRPVQMRPGLRRYEGNWSTDAGGTINQYTIFPGHENRLNWQASTIYADQGKRKSVVQYFDGTLRNRQTVSKDNTTNTTIVAESFYDYQGRPVIQVLPAPTLSNIIAYTKDFNIAGINTPYDKSLYDTLLIASDYCLSAAPPMDSSSGAANYYSSSNPNASGTNYSYDKFIPKATGYAFTELRYEQDNTGRVKSQSSVGPNHLIGSGHETRYFYGNPSQEELNALFGTEVGYASHYFKNMVRDANGQYRVTYQDMHGRTIATALAGRTPTGMDSLSSNTTRTLTEKLADSTNNIQYGVVLESSRTIQVPSAGNYSFQYSLNSDSLRIRDCANNDICYDCLYNLTITITDDCNNCRLPGNLPYVIVDTNFTGASIDTLCNATVGFNTSFTLTNLNEGNYTVTKKLEINREKYAYYRDSIFLVKNVCKTFNDFYQAAIDSIKNGQDCSELTCTDCSARLASFGTYRTTWLNEGHIPLSDSAIYRTEILNAYNREKEVCNTICQNNSDEISIRKMMLQDMTAPYGQYANPDSVLNDNSDYNIFKQITTPVWNNPSITYYDDEGKKDSIYNDIAELVPVNDPSITQENYITHFKTSWANSLLPYHPEYAKLLEYEKHKSSNAWDVDFGSVETYLEANTKGYLRPWANVGTVPTPIPAHFTNNSANWDPLTKADSLLYLVLPEALYTYQVVPSVGTYSAWGIASITAKCTDSDDQNCHLRFLNTHLDSCINEPYGFCTGELDMAWRAFRELYLNKKRKMFMDELASMYPVSPAIPAYKFEYFKASSPENDEYATFVSGAGSGSDVLSDVGIRSQQFYTDNCQAYAQSWLTSLAPCNLTTDDSARLIPRMVQICVGGSDTTHAFGSSSTAPGVSLPYTSFEALIRHYIDSMHTVDPVRYNYNTACNSYSIYFPMPYDQQQSLTNIPVYSKPDSCQCERVSALYNEYRQYGVHDASFAAYVLRQTGTSMTDADLLTLRNLCNGLDTCKFLVTPVTLPPALQCGIKEVCVTCTQIRNAFDSFKVVFPNTFPSYDGDDSIQVEKNKVFTDYMNHKFGFSKQLVDYLQFMDNCGINYLLDSAACESLKSILTSYQTNVFNSHIPHLDAGGCDTTFLKINKQGQTNVWNHDPSIHLADWMTNSVVRIPFADTSTFSPRIMYFDTLCIDNAFTFAGRFKFNSSDSAHDKWVAKHPAIGNYYSVHRFEFHMNNKDVVFDFVPGKYWHSSNVDSVFGILSFTEGGTTVTRTDISLQIKDLRRWVDFKADFRSGNCKFYVNNSLVWTEAYANPFSQVYPMAVSYYGHTTDNGQMDNIRMYDESNQLRYYEDFIGCQGLAKQTIRRCNNNCQSGFANYFNTIKGTSYSFAQVDSVYFSTCNTHPNPCTDDPKNCTVLKQAIADQYYSRFGITYDTSGAEQNVIAIGGQYVTRSAGSIYNIKDFVVNGMISTPDSVIVSPGDFHYSYLLDMCIGNEFSLESRVRVKPGFDSTALQQIALFSLKGGTANYSAPLIQFTGNSNWDGFQGSYRDNIDTIHALWDFSQAPMLAVNFYDWRVVRYTFKDNKILVYVDGDLKGSVYFPGNFYRMDNFYLSGWYSTPIQIDYYKLLDRNGVVRLDENFNDFTNYQKPPADWVCPEATCASTFTSFFNARFGTSLTSQQCAKYYQEHCGIYLGACGLNESLLCGKTEPIFPPIQYTQPGPCADSSDMAYVIATELYENYLDSLRNAFDSAYTAKCLKAFKTESFTVTHPMNIYHYTLFYYDQAGNLVKAIPPSAVDTSKFSVSNWSYQVDTARKGGSFLVPSHGLKSEYRYNTLNKVKEQNSPDGGVTVFWYDLLGRLAVSQNARQKALTASEAGRQYTYTLYDYLGRINQVGQFRNSTNTPMTDALAIDSTGLTSWLNTIRKSQIVRTFYDLPYAAFTAAGTPIVAKNLRNRVAYTMVVDSLNAGQNIDNYNTATFYSYDIHGNVDTLVQDYGSSSLTATKVPMNGNNITGGGAGILGNRWKKMVYKYDLISGKVNHVAYAPNQPDAFYHKYEYDAANRLTAVYTSSDSAVWEKDARYSYYRHGPLARTVIGDQMVQGMDYAYTIQGWLKGVNSTLLDLSYDMGSDGLATNATTKFIARDAFGFNLNYFAGDYNPIGGSIPFAGYIGNLPSGAYRPLYNGNISSMAVNIGQFNNPLLYNYKYDQLNRLTEMDAYKGLNSTNNTWDSISVNGSYHDYKEKVAYDPNGNILKYLRYGVYDAGSSSSYIMDSLNYKYNYSSGVLQNNRLNWVSDSIPAGRYSTSNSSPFNTDDIDDQSGLNVSGKFNYQYDPTGNLIKDSSQKIWNITWGINGKIRQITKLASAPGDISTIAYTYDATGNRISKVVTSIVNVGAGTNKYDYTCYVRDASGNIMSTYNYAVTSTFYQMTNDTLWQKEVLIYGSGRLGTISKSVNVEKLTQVGSSIGTFAKAGSTIGWAATPFTRGKKQYELSNHLGNVLATVSDKKIPHTTNGTTIDYYNADVITANDYYPFGMVMPGRKFQAGSSSYRFSINGQEKDRELNENITTAQYWEYDSRIGKRWNIDPKMNLGFSPYSVFDDNPIWKNDILGDSAEVGPGPASVAVGTATYYKDRYSDFMKRHSKLTENIFSRKHVLTKQPPSYYLNYGDKYMNKFQTKTRATLSKAGQKWLDETLVNLQEALETKLTATKEGATIENDDEKFTDFAFDTHVSAYEKAGVLSLPIMDKVKIALTPDAKDLFSDRGLKQVGKIATDQAKFYIKSEPTIVIYQAAEFISHLNEILTMVHSYYIENKPFFDEMAKENPQDWSDPEHKIIRTILTPLTFSF